MLKELVPKTKMHSRNHSDIDLLSGNSGFCIRNTGRFCSQRLAILAESLPDFPQYLHGNAHSASCQWVPETLSLVVKQQRREADHSPPSSATVKNAWIYTSTPPYIFMAGCLVKHRDKFTFTFTTTATLHVLSNSSFRVIHAV
jgi:hypothetical protein